MSVGKRLLSLTTAALLVISLGGCGEKEKAFKRPAPLVSADDGDFEEINGNAVMENGGVRFELNAETAHFTVTDKANGKVYSSVPAGETEYISDELSARISSDLTIEYYGEQTDKMFMYSGDCVGNGGISVKRSDNAIRVTYVMGEAESFVPEILDEEAFKTVSEQLGSDGLRRRLERYYVFTSVKQKKGDYSAAAKKYSVLSKQNLYILDGMITDIEKDDIALYISQTDFDSEAYEKMLVRLGIEGLSVEKSAGFTVPVEYTLTDNGFNASVLVDRIKENSPDYKLQKIDLLEYFAAYPAVDGSFFIPDGCGATVNFNTEGELSVPFYGQDYSIRRESEDEINKNLCFPVFGITGPDSGVFAIAEQASEVASLHISPKSSSSALNHAYLSFVYRSIDVTDYGANMQIPIYNLFSKTTLSESPSVRYFLLSGENREYPAMAKLYSDYLAENGVVNNDNEGGAVYLDYLCMITEQASMLGVPYTKKTVLSTLDGIISSVEKIHSAGLKNVTVRLFGYTRNGYEHSAYTAFELDKRIGTKKQLAELNSLLESNGGKLYLDADMQFSYRSSKSFSASEDSARYLNRLVVCRGNYDTVSRKYTDVLRKYFITPAEYENISGSFAASLAKNFKGGTAPGISFGNAGLYLGGDYSKKRDLNRCESAEMLENALKNAEKSGTGMIFDNGNAYILKYADAVVNVPQTCSGYDSESASVPFMQMVLSGKTPFAQTPWNLASDPTDAHLNSGVMNAGAYTCFITEPDELIYNTPYETMWYSLCDASRLDGFIEKAKAVFEIQESLKGAEFIGYSESNGVCRAEYSGGKTVYANFNDFEAAVNGITVPARGMKTEGTEK